MARKHDSLREGAWLGVVVATSIWVWLAVVDAAVGQPFRTFTVLGGLALFTILHYLFNAVYGIVIVSLVHGADDDAVDGVEQVMQDGEEGEASSSCPWSTAPRASRVS